MDQNDLFLIEATVNNISVKDVNRNNLILTVNTGLIFTLDVDIGENSSVTEGKSSLFPSKAEDLFKLTQNSQIEITAKLKGNYDPLATACFPWPAPFVQLIQRQAQQRSDKSGPATVSSTYELLDLYQGNPIGEVNLTLRMVIFGGHINTPFQLIRNEQTQSASYLIKGTGDNTTFRLQRPKNASEDIFPVAPMMPMEKPKMEAAPRRHSAIPRQSSRLLDMSKSEIESRLCGKTTCPGVIKFKDYGIGPLAPKIPEPSLDEEESEESLPRDDWMETGLEMEVCNAPTCPFKDTRDWATQSPEIIEKTYAPCGIPTCKRTKKLTIELPQRPVGPCGNPNCPHVLPDLVDQKEQKRVVCKAKSCQVDPNAALTNVNEPVPAGFKAICSECGGLSKSGRTCIDLLIQSGGDKKEDEPQTVAPDKSKVIKNMFAAIADVFGATDVHRLDECIYKLYFKILDPITFGFKNKKFTTKFLEIGMNSIPVIFQIPAVAPASFTLSCLINQTMWSIVALHTKKNLNLQERNIERDDSETSMSTLPLYVLENFYYTFCNQNVSNLFRSIAEILNTQNEERDESVNKFHAYIENLMGSFSIDERNKLECCFLADQMGSVFKNKMPGWITVDDLRSVIFVLWILNKDIDKSMYYEMTEKIKNYESKLLKIIAENSPKMPNVISTFRSAYEIKDSLKGNFLRFYVDSSISVSEVLYDVLMGVSIKNPLADEPVDDNERVTSTADNISNDLMAMLNISDRWYTKDTRSAIFFSVSNALKQHLWKLSFAQFNENILANSIVEIRYPRSPVTDKFLSFIYNAEVILYDLIVSNLTTLKSKKLDNNKDIISDYYQTCENLTKLILPYVINLGIDIYDLMAGQNVTIKSIKNTETISEEIFNQIVLTCNGIVDYYKTALDLFEEYSQYVVDLMCIFVQKSIKQEILARKRLDLLRAQLANRKTSKKFVYVGNEYPGVRIGHKYCLPRASTSAPSTVPASMGWLWNIPPVGRLKYRRGWKPGKIGKSINNLMKGIREMKKSKVGRRRVFKSEWNPNPPKEPPYSVDEKPTLHIKKKDGIFVITMNPLKDPYTVEDNEDPYMNCTPIQFRIAKKCDLIEKDPDDIDSWDEESSEKESEIDIEFTTPAGVIDPNKMKKKPNVAHTDTQYKVADFDPAAAAAESKKGKKGGKGKKKK